MKHGARVGEVISQASGRLKTVPPIRWAMRPAVRRWVFLCVFIASTALGTALLSTDGFIWLIGDGYWIAADRRYGLYAGHYAHIPRPSSMAPGAFVHWWWVNGMGRIATVAFRPKFIWLTSFVALCLTFAAWIPFFISRWRSRYVGKCPKCRYDRTGLELDAVCPECGSPAPPIQPSP